jgi:type IV pilus assembly protein PilV
MQTANKSNRISRKEQGFTLIEIMISLAIFSIGLLALSAMQNTATNSNALGRVVTESSIVGMDQIEKIVALQYEDIAPSSTTTTTEGPYNITVEVSAEHIPIDNVKTITVTVSRPELFKTRNVSFTYFRMDI